MEVHPNTAVVGCKLLFPDGRLQRSVGAFPCALNAFLEASFLYLLMPKTRLASRLACYFDYSVERDSWVMGAYFMIRRSSIQELGPLDEQFYMYTEETDFCLRAKKAGQRSMVCSHGEGDYSPLGWHECCEQTCDSVGTSQSASVAETLLRHGKACYSHVQIWWRTVPRRCVFCCWLVHSESPDARREARYFADAIVLLSSRRWLYNREPMKQMIPWTRFT